MKKTFTTPKTLILTAIAAAVLFSACRSSQLIRPGDPLDVSYNKAWELYENKKYGDAAEAFETITRIGRGTEFAQDAQYYLAESYYKDRRYLLAESEYERFIGYFPRDERREEVEFKRALSLYQQSPRYKLDQSSTRKAIELFQLFNNNYPDSELVPESADKINELRNKLAHKVYSAADFYSRNHMYQAAILYYDLTIDRYPESKWAEQALVELINTYNRYADRSVDNKKAERYEGALKTYEKFLQLFPSSELRGDAERYRDEAEIGYKKAPKPEAEGVLSSVTN